MSEENKDQVTEDVKPSETVTTNETPTVVASATEETKTETAEKSSKPTTEKDAKYVPLTELIKERQRRRELEAELKAEIDALKGQMKPQSDPVKTIREKLNVDDETAKNLHDLGLGKVQAPQQNEEELLKINFIRKAEDVSRDYEDWEEMKPDMEKVLKAEYEKNPRMALLKHPETYYLQAKLQRSQKEKEASVKEAVDKSNGKNLATVESAKNSSPRPDLKAKRGSREWLKGLSQDEFVKEYDYIKTLQI